MASYVVSGAGDASYNGTYNENGTANGYARYTIVGGGRELYRAADMPPPMGTWTWRLYTSVQGISPPAGAAYYKTGGITGTYTRGSGTAPAPTVATAPSSAQKTFDGLVRASVKTVDGLAIASVKTRDGLA